MPDNFTVPLYRACPSVVDVLASVRDPPEFRDPATVDDLDHRSLEDAHQR